MMPFSSYFTTSFESGLGLNFMFCVEGGTYFDEVSAFSIAFKVLGDARAILFSERRIPGSFGVVC